MGSRGRSPVTKSQSTAALRPNSAAAPAKISITTSASPQIIRTIESARTNGSDISRHGGDEPRDSDSITSQYDASRLLDYVLARRIRQLRDVDVDRQRMATPLFDDVDHSLPHCRKGVA